jgi:DNA-binding transcriptional regulator YbjK
MAPAPAPPLSRAVVVDAGVALVAEGGMAALTMRRIA